MFVDWKQSQLASFEITFRAKYISNSIPGLKSTSSSWTECSAPCIRNSNMDEKAWSVTLPSSMLCTWQGHGNSPSFHFLPTDCGEGGCGELRMRIHIFSNIVSFQGPNVRAIILWLISPKYPQHFFNFIFFLDSVGFISIHLLKGFFLPFLPELFTCCE